MYGGGLTDSGYSHQIFMMLEVREMVSVGSYDTRRIFVIDLRRFGNNLVDKQMLRRVGLVGKVNENSEVQRKG